MQIYDAWIAPGIQNMVINKPCLKSYVFITGTSGPRGQ